ncbi:cyclodeaminase/cyclohydrolase family protein [Actinomycetospora sp. NBRC 106378]|uniref:cyclodeaminase/cyclohydrolase family protein n=1 Tax=Actinomycetospora sp. NBRC 106378 TaxID=3032208 RepID=UPI0024A3F9A3|nr:cyclodeaminase/cyclohydrolase family protein [Actinomycetospora sp. NBRC 106378]GLZ54646.1 hypothetical protein Acsp07_42630 [Actinomycetospora sp. NBRC 106378]
MRNRTIEAYLADLASPHPVPGGATGAALHAAQGAALVAMVARRSDGGAAPADVVVRIRERGDALREVALDLADADAGAVAIRVLEVTEELLTLAETLRPLTVRAVAPGVAAAAEALRAAAGTARVTVEVDLVDRTEPTAREELLEAVDHVDDLVLRAAKVTAAVREQIVR